MQSTFDPYAFLGKKLLENAKVFQQQAPKQEVLPFKQEVVPFPLKGMDLTTGMRGIDLNQNYFVVPEQTSEKPFVYLSETTDPKLPYVPPVGDLQEDLSVLKPFLDEQRQRDIQFYQDVANLEREQQLAAAREMFPLINEASEAAFERGIRGDILSPTKKQKRALSAQTGEATLMQAIASQANAAANMAGSFRGKNIAIS